MSSEQAKRRAAQAALEYLPGAGIVGIGSGSTASLFIEELAQAVARGAALRAVATSEGSRQLAQKLGIEVLPDAGPWQIAVTVDGADEVTPALDLIKGRGGCHTREKLVNRASALNVIVADDSKLCRVLGEKHAVPIEVLLFGHGATGELLQRFGTATLRLRAGEPWLTDSGNYIYDLETGPIANPAELERELRGLPGVIETGLFLGRADIVLVAGAGGVRRLFRAGMPATDSGLAIDNRQHLEPER